MEGGDHDDDLDSPDFSSRDFKRFKTIANTPEKGNHYDCVASEEADLRMDVCRAEKILFSDSKVGQHSDLSKKRAPRREHMSQMVLSFGQ